MGPTVILGLLAMRGFQLGPLQGGWFGEKVCTSAGFGSATEWRQNPKHNTLH